MVDLLLERLRLYAVTLSPSEKNMKSLQGIPIIKSSSRLLVGIGLALAMAFAGCGGEVATDGELEVASKISALSCSGRGCDGLDPEATGCSADAKTLASEDHIDGGKVELRWSKNCDTKWARVTRANRYQTTAWLQTTPYDLDTTVSGSWDGLVSKLVWGNMSYSPGQKLSACTYISNCLGGCGAITDYKCTPLAKE